MKEPINTTLRAYQVGFGDCFLLTFHYEKNEKRHMLIDFGSTGLPEGFPKDQMMLVAQDIEKQCGGKLHAIVASHRHKDHISGFSTQQKHKNGKSTGEVIRGMDPDLIILPWTEHPGLKVDATSAAGMIGAADYKKEPNKAFVATLQNMQASAKAVKSEAERLSLKYCEGKNEKGFLKPMLGKLSSQLSFMGDNNLPNLSAVKNLMEMASEKGSDGKPKGRYVSYNCGLDISGIFPGVKVSVLGPPTLEQYQKIINERSKDKEEFWMLRAIHKNFWGMQAATSKLLENLNENEELPDKIFPDAGVYKNYEPSHTRWFTRRIRAMRGEQLLGLVRILDDAMNNTSVILLIEAAGKKLLFPGDAQIENWEYALKYAPEKNANLKLLKGTTLYKVGHHGSRNATPKTLWENFARKTSGKSNEDALHSVNSTMAGKHGTTPATAVPRATLVEALREHSHYHTTEEVKAGDSGLCVEIGL